MQHPLQDDRLTFSSISDHDRRASPSSSCISRAATATATCSSSVDNSTQTGSAAKQPPGSYAYRQLFSEEAGAEAAGSFVQELLQLQLPPATSTEVSFDVLSSSSVYDTYASSRCNVEDRNSPLSFSVEGFLTSSGAAPESPKVQKGPHTLEFVSPLATCMSQQARSTHFPDMNSNDSRLPDAAASPTLLPEVQTSTVDSSLQYAKGVNTLCAKAISFNGDEEESYTVSQLVASSFKKAKLQASEQSTSGAGSDSFQYQGIMSKVQSSRSKEKLGERINALQQLVSPFGKTDTASVLSEAIGYIKFLQDQVQVLSSPYMKPTSTFTCKDVGAESSSDLRSRGLCLVPVSCTLNVANNNNFNIGADYWASSPSVGGSTPSTRFSASS